MANNRWDFSDILLQQRAGQIMGQAYAGLGQQAGGALKEFGEQKKQNQAMKGEVDSAANFFESATDMVQKKADAEMQASGGKLSDETFKLLQATQQTLGGLHDPNRSLVERHAMAKSASKNLFDLINLGTSTLQNRLISAQAKGVELSNADIEAAQRAYNEANPSVVPQTQQQPAQGYSGGAVGGAPIPQQGGMSGISNAWNNRTGQAPTAGVQAQVPQPMPQQGATGVSAVDLQKLSSPFPIQGQNPNNLINMGAQAVGVLLQQKQTTTAPTELTEITGKPAKSLVRQFREEFGKPGTPGELMEYSRLKTSLAKQTNLVPASLWRLPNGQVVQSSFNPANGDTVYPDPNTGKLTSLPKNSVPTSATDENELAKKGLKWNNERNGFESIPGGPLDFESQVKKGVRAYKTKQSIDSINNVVSLISETIPRINTKTSGMQGALMANVVGSEAYNVKESLDSVNANLGFDRLQQMREASPTGGALGQVAVMELKRLERAKRSLAQGQSDVQLIKNLNEVKDAYTKWSETIQKANEIGEPPVGVKWEMWEAMTPQERAHF